MVALGRKNHLFAGSDGGAERWATVCSLIAMARLNDIEPYAYLSDVLRRMVNGHPVNRLDDLLPWNWTPISANPRSTCNARTLTDQANGVQPNRRFKSGARYQRCLHLDHATL